MEIIKKTFLELIIVAVVATVLVLSVNYFSDNSEIEEISEDTERIVTDAADIVDVRINQSYLTLEIADDADKRALGLMHREDLNSDNGMIFVYDEENLRSFWMKNVLIPLDMIFVNEELEIVGFIEDVPICEEDPCPTYSVEEPSKYVIEVNAGWISKNNVEIGDRIDFIVQDLFSS